MFFYADAGDFIICYTRRGASTALSRAFPQRLTPTEVLEDGRPVRMYMREPVDRLESCFSLFWDGDLNRTLTRFIETRNLHWNPLSWYPCLAGDIRPFNQIKELGVGVANKSNRDIIYWWTTKQLIAVRQHWKKDFEVYSGLV